MTLTRRPQKRMTSGYWGVHSKNLKRGVLVFILSIPHRMRNYQPPFINNALHFEQFCSYQSCKILSSSQSQPVMVPAMILPDASEVVENSKDTIVTYIYTSAAAICLTSLITAKNLPYPSSVVISVSHLSAGTVSLTGTVDGAT